MNGHSRHSQGSNPSAEGTPSSGNENAQIQWVLTAIADLKASSGSLHQKLDGHIDSINNKIDRNNNEILVKLTEKNKNIEDKIDSKQQVLELKIESTHDSIKSKHELTCEKMISLEASIINKIREDQKTTNRWVIGMLIAVALGILGIAVRIFL
jgi:hypothetical protein